MKNNRRIFYTLIVILVTIGVSLAVQLVLADDAAARPGGGHGFRGGGGYHGGGSHYHGSGSGGGSFFINFTGSFGTDLIINLLIWAIILWISSKFKSGHDDDSVSSVATLENRRQERSSIKQKIGRLIGSDRNFSKFIFLDYVTMLYNRLYLSCNKPEIEEVKPFFIGSLPNFLGKNTYSEITIGSIGISDVDFRGDCDVITVSINSNYTITNLDNHQAYRADVEESWQLTRKKGTLSPAPQGFGVIRCPHCGSAIDFKDSGVCAHCGTVISFESGQWMVSKVYRKRINRTSTSDMLTYEDEEGTDEPTVFDDNLNYGEKIFVSNHGNIYNGFKDFGNVVAKPYFREIYKHWAENTWNQARHLLSERQWNNFNEYHNQLAALGYTNRLDNLKITNVEIVKYEADHNYEAITARIFAECFDYIVNADGKPVAGDNKRPRRFSEYWTFVASKRATFERNDLSKCPSCGAPIDRMGEAGICEYCGNKITDGNFSWVLFSITQDEVYMG
ncbi:MAG: TIM44-like domain-containing protein [Bacteroidales bacterium]|nr:TIM44-like domain-containing protein [Bacteroidales bacterium]